MAKDIIGAGSAWMTGLLIDNASVAAIYSRNGDEVKLRAVASRSLLQLGDEQGGSRTVKWEDDWLIRVEDLALSSGLTDPLIGDRIFITSGAKQGTYAVLEPGGGEPHATRSSDGLMWRLHTKRLKAEP